MSEVDWQHQRRPRDSLLHLRQIMFSAHCPPRLRGHPRQPGAGFLHQSSEVLASLPSLVWFQSWQTLSQTKLFTLSLVWNNREWVTLLCRLVQDKIDIKFHEVCVWWVCVDLNIQISNGSKLTKLLIYFHLVTTACKLVWRIELNVVCCIISFHCSVWFGLRCVLVDVLLTK